MKRALFTLLLTAASLGCQGPGPGPGDLNELFNTGDCRPDIGPWGTLVMVPTDEEDDEEDCYTAVVGLVDDTGRRYSIVVVGEDEDGETKELAIDPLQRYSLRICFDDEEASLTNSLTGETVHFDVRTSARRLVGATEKFDSEGINSNERTSARLRVIDGSGYKFVRAQFMRRYVLPVAPSGAQPPE